MNTSIKFFWWDITSHIAPNGCEVFSLKNDLIFVKIKRDTSMFTNGPFDWIGEFKLYSNDKLIYFMPCAYRDCPDAQTVAKKIEHEVVQLFGALVPVCT